MSTNSKKSTRKDSKTLSTAAAYDSGSTSHEHFQEIPHVLESYAEQRTDDPYYSFSDSETGKEHYRRGS